ncbi:MULTISPECIES: iron uptake system protein EfeO [unclassified Mycobacterium]|uniref:iron uptake system protein EfeO n=1 Tax=unclassified Mycobacterium TaxID=2642494 RepID=UPI00074037FF|nr:MULTISPECIES: iron uptake system protein EfeO [unclassified Mycobacterium]KUH82699.1 peptidase M75 [Mycobacterium sp. GA-1999]KUH88032.1 peptidase M75 [Mycobacterium sp. GA-0227b]
MACTVHNAKTGLTAAVLLVGLTAMSISGCAPKPTVPDGKADGNEITVAAGDESCQLSAASADTGTTTFVITNHGTTVTEFYVYGAGDRVMGTVGNISPGLQRKLILQLPEPGRYYTACKPGMVGDGIRGDFTVTGKALAADSQDKFKEAIDSYKAYVTGQTTNLVTVTETFAGATKKGDWQGAQELYSQARTYYGRIEQIAASFPNELDRRIDLREADLRPGERWTGFHRLEKDLWVSNLQPDTGAIADQLVADVKELDALVKDPKWTIDATEITGGAQRLLDRIVGNTIAGEEEVFSHTDLWDIQANLDGARVAVGSVRPIIDERDHELGAQVDLAFAQVQGLLDKHQWNAGFVPYDKVTEPERHELSLAIEGLIPEVNKVQGVISRQ